jgi:hypothetical protein
MNLLASIATAPRARLRSGLAALALLALSGVTAGTAGADHPGSARAGDLGVPGLSERQLRSFEQGVLGPAHAAEHASQRQALKRGGSRAVKAAADSGPATLAASTTTDPAVAGRWGAPFPIPVMGIHSALLPTGKVLWWSYPINPNRPYGDPSYPNTAQAWLWDPASGATKRIDPPLVRDPDTGQMQPANIWCSGQSFLADGRLLVTGGNLRYKGAGNPPSVDYSGLNKVFTFNPYDETWTEQPDMAHGRWYPSQVLLPDGRTVIMSGFDESGTGYAGTNKDVEVFTPSADMNGRGTITKLGVRGQAGSPPDGGLYPHMFTMPSGRVMVAGPDPNDSWFLSDPGPGNAFGFSDFPALSRQRLWGAGVLLPAGPAGSTKVELLGGSQYTDGAAVASTEVIDEDNAAAGFKAAGPLNIGRSHLNTVLLPDGSMVTVGGGVGKREPEGQWAADPEQRQVELYDPQSGTWTLGAAQAESRAYHSTALLLPDARVVSAGDDVNGGIDRDTAEIYEPPYLFKGPRPSIAQAPATIRTGEAFAVEATGATVQRAVLVAPGATTHANDMSQRVVPLAGTPTATGLDLTGPPSANVAPPGRYMLFALSDQGVPSVARWVKVEKGTLPPPSGLVAEYSFDEGSGAAVADASGKDNDGTVAGAAWTGAGKNAGALSFDGIDDLVSVPDATSLDLTAGMTLEAWVRPDAVNGWRTAILKERPGDLAYALYPSTSGGRPNGEAGLASVYGPAGIPAGAWTHLATTYDGSVLKLYVNGAEAAARNQAVSVPTSNLPLRIGGNTVWGEYFDGLIDDVRVYNRALTPAEVLADRDRAVDGGPPPPPPPDTTAPSVSVSAPAGGSTVYGTVDVTAAASDNVGVSGVQFKLDGQNLGQEDVSGPYGTTWTTTGVPNGNHQLTAVARDAAGNTATSTTVTVNVQNDTTAPTASITAPANGATVSGSQTVTASASDNVGVAGVQFMRDGQELGAEDTTAPYSTSWNTASVPNGTHNLTAVARDAAGNAVTSSVVAVNVQNDATPPTVSVTAPANGATVSGTLNVSATAADNVGVSGVQFKLNGQNLGTEDTAAPYGVSWNTTTVVNGNHQLTAVARDPTGNTTASSVVTVNVQNAAPPPAGLVAAYSFNEGSGTMATDASSARNTGTVSGASWTAAGRNGGALVFDGVNDWVTVADSASLDLTTGMTLEAWVRPTTTGQAWRTLILKETLSNLVYGSYTATTQAGRPNVEIGSTALYGTGALAVNTWTHVTATYDRATLRLYVNGTQVASRAHTALIGTSAGALRIGGNAIWGEFFAGTIDNVRVYNRALTAAQVMSDRDTPVPLGTP